MLNSPIGLSFFGVDEGATLCVNQASMEASGRAALRLGVRRRCTKAIPIFSPRHNKRHILMMAMR